MKKITLAASAAVLVLAGTAWAAEHGGMRMMKDPMGDKTVTRAEAESKAKEHFVMMDVNKDGKLDKADQEARHIEHFKKLDTDGNGSISQSEFLVAHQGKGNDEGKRGGPGMAKSEHDGGHGGKGMGGRGKGMMMHMADVNSDGTITQAEFTANALKHFDMVDANKDGKATPEERRAAMAKMKGAMKEMRGKHRMGGMPMGDGPPPPPPGN